MAKGQAVGAGTDVSFQGDAPEYSGKTRENNKRWLTIKRNFPLYIMLLPGLIVLVINNYLPMIGVIIPFEDYRYDGKSFFSSLFDSKFVGFSNFAFLFKSADVINATRNTILYNIVFIILDVVIPVTLAIALTEITNKKLSKLYQAVGFLPYFLSWVIISYIAYACFSTDNGLFNRTIMTALGMGHDFPWYSTPRVWPAILIFFHLWRYTGYNLIMYMATISGISDEYYEAAALDGATKWQQIKYITLPMLKNVMVILSLLAVGRIFNGDFDLFYNVPKNAGALFDATQVIDTYVYNALITMGNMPMSAAAGIYQAVVGCVIVFLANALVRHFDKESALF